MHQRIIVYTRDRPLYFELTMNGLLFSLHDCDIPITIMLNDPCPKTLELAQKFQDKDERIDVLQAEHNCAFAGMTVGINWHRPEVITIVQDDHILPYMTRQHYPQWPHRFAGMLDGMDCVFFGCHLLNLPCDSHVESDPKKCRPFEIHQPTDSDGEFWYFRDPQNAPPVFLFQPCVMTYEFWKSVYNSGPKCAVDSLILANAKSMAQASKVVTTHIGWGRDMDGYNTEKEWKDAFSIPFNVVSVKSLKTGEVRDISLDIGQI